MQISKFLTAPVKLLTLFVVLSVIPLAALGWLGWRMLEQDRALESQHLRERLENADSLLAHEMDRTLSGWENALTSAATGKPDAVPPGAIMITFDSGGILSNRGIAIPYYPVAASSPDVPDALFVTAEAQEFHDEDPAMAADSYRAIASAAEGRLRAAALMRLARCLRKIGNIKEALATYSQLGALSETPVAGLPSELIAHRERIALFKMIGDEESERHEINSLAALLSAGSLVIDQGTYDFYRESTGVASDMGLTESKTNALQLARAVEGMWPLLQQQASGRTTWADNGSTSAAVWRHTSTGTAVIVGMLETLIKPTLSVAENLQVQMALEDPAGHVIWGTHNTTEMQATKTLRELGLPWTLHVTALDPAAIRSISASRRNLMIAGFGLMVLMIAAASYFVFRAVNRELAVARLQSDFVAAVSHEFRTPLTAMRHLTDMLEEGGTPEERLPQYYRALGKETRRLHATVESLLDFGRMASGRRTYHMEETSAEEISQQVVEACRDQASSASHHLELRTSEGQRSRQLRIRGDRDALAVALRNLVDNAIKYSPDSSTVTVSVESQGHLAGISVTDQGMGIPQEEQREVFRKFVRGTSAKTLNVKGTGIGLAMATQIVEAHGGRLELTSKPGRGSRFTILLPLERKHA